MLINLWVPVLILMTQTSQGENQLQEAVNKLGGKQSAGIIQVELVKSPAAAIDLILDSIHSIEKQGVITENEHDAMQLVWKIRALRYLSGKNFYSEISKKDFEKLGEDSELFMSMEGVSKNRFPLFATWRSRGIVVLAPRSVQERIIEKWKTWARTKKGIHTNTDLNFWYD